MLYDNLLWYCAQTLLAFRVDLFNLQYLMQWQQSSNACKYFLEMCTCLNLPVKLLAGMV